MLLFWLCLRCWCLCVCTVYITKRIVDSFIGLVLGLPLWQATDDAFERDEFGFSVDDCRDYVYQADWYSKTFSQQMRFIRMQEDGDPRCMLCNAGGSIPGKCATIEHLDSSPHIQKVTRWMLTNGLAVPDPFSTSSWGSTSVDEVTVDLIM